MTDIENQLNEFMKEYEKACSDRIFLEVQKLLAKDATYWFTDGAFNGVEEIKTAFENTWKKIQSETYKITNLEWIALSENSGTCTCIFKWSGLINGVRQSGKGRGTNVVVKLNDKWLMKHEHLSKWQD